MTRNVVVHVVDDDAAIRDSLKLMLQTRGFSVRVYSSASTFLARIGRQGSGCVVADARMPEMTGVALLERMRALGLLLPVVIITASADAELAAAAMRAGASDLLEKPFEDETLLASLGRAFAAGRGKAARDAHTRDIIARLSALTPYEKRVLAELSKGRQSKDIAHDFGVAVRSVELCRANIMAKTNTASLVELMRMSLVSARAGHARIALAPAASARRGA